MTKIVYDREEYCVTVEGHAGYGAAGTDIVCAGLSALTEALLRRASGRPSFQAACGVNRSEAKVRVRLTPRSRRAAALARELLETVCAGYEAVAEQFPDYVRFEVR